MPVSAQPNKNTEIDPEAISRDLMDYAVNVKALAAHLTDLPEQLNNKWVGVYGGEIKLICDSFDDLERLASVKGLPLRSMLVKFISDQEGRFVL